MLKRIMDFVRKAFGQAPIIGQDWLLNDAVSRGPKGEVFIKITKPDGTPIEDIHIPNVVTKDMSILLAWMAWQNSGPTHGILGLAVGTGDPSWNLGANDAPPPATDEQRSLFAEIERKAFLSKTFVDGTGTAVGYPTNVVDFTTRFDVGEASQGALVEMGLIGGDANINSPNPIANGAYDPTVDVQGSDILCNYLTFKPINKPASSVMTITWRITF